jgi:hypothetical protein
VRRDSNVASEMHIGAARLLEQWQKYAQPDTEAERHLATARQWLLDLVVVNLRRIEALEQLSSRNLTIVRAADVQRRLHELCEEYDDARPAFVDHLFDVLAPSLGFDGQQVGELRRVFEVDRLREGWLSHDLRPKWPASPRRSTRHRAVRARLVDRGRRRPAHAHVR